MNRLRVTANSRDAAIRAQWKRAQEHLIMANTAAEEHAAELEQGPEAAIGNDPLAKIEGETHGTDADAAEYLQQSDETLEAPEAPEAPEAEEGAPEEE
jgi:DNA-directed RNA polymerase subunit beta'